MGQVNAVLMLQARSGLRLGEIARLARLPRQIVASALRTLERRGLVKRSRVVDHDVFIVDTSSLHYPAAYLSSLVDLPIAAALARFRPLAVYCYGSMAVPGGGAPGSDLDLLIVGDFRDPDAVREALAPVEQQIGRRIDAFILTPEQLEAAVRRDDPHVHAARSGVRLLGSV